MAIEMQAVLPDKPSALIRQALADLEIVESRPECVIEMYDHYMLINDEGEAPGTCVMCMAGAVMYLGSSYLRDLLADGTQLEILPLDFETPITDKLRFISEFQFGEFASAFCELELPRPTHLPPSDITFPLYSRDSVAYKKALREHADKLEAIGL